MKQMSLLGSGGHFLEVPSFSLHPPIFLASMPSTPFLSYFLSISCLHPFPPTPQPCLGTAVLLEDRLLKHPSDCLLCELLVSQQI